VALADAVEIVTGLRIYLKWPNHLYFAQRKLGGILAEGVGPATGNNRWSGPEREGAHMSGRGDGSPPKRSLDTRERDGPNASASADQPPVTVPDTRERDGAKASASRDEGPLRRSVPDTRERDGAKASASGDEGPLRRSVLDTRERSGANASASGGGAPREVINVVVGY